jgi:hypothetical protein
LRQRVWQAAHVDLKTITLDTDSGLMHEDLIG